jgi:hypothetical protein
MLAITERERRGLVRVEGVDEGQEMREQPLRRRYLALTEETDRIEEAVQTARELLQTNGERRVEKKQALDTLIFFEDQVSGGVVGADITYGPAAEVARTMELAAANLGHI